jgi:hypothetical protein
MKPSALEGSSRDGGVSLDIEKRQIFRGRLQDDAPAMPASFRERRFT